MGNRATVTQVPSDLQDEVSMRRFLEDLTDNVSRAIGYASNTVNPDQVVPDLKLSAPGQLAETTPSVQQLSDNLGLTSIAASDGATLLELETQVNTLLTALEKAKVLK